MPNAAGMTFRKREKHLHNWELDFGWRNIVGKHREWCADLHAVTTS
jgi:hypothetical protein